MLRLWSFPRSCHTLCLWDITKEAHRSYLSNRSNRPKQINAPLQMVKKLLIAFDFDHTVIDGNSDTVVRELLRTKPQECKPAESWTTYMQNIFNLLHDEGAQESLYLDTISNIPPTPGMMDLLEFLKNPEVEIIIISDSNSIFIQTWLEKMNLTDSIQNVYTNQASFDSTGLLNITMYHSQNWCDKCPENLCKGSVLDEHLKSRHEAGVTFSSVAYVGDGKNDFCPSTKLSDIDHVFPRKGFSLEKLLTNPQTDEENKKKIMANVCVWSSALEIKAKLSEII